MRAKQKPNLAMKQRSQPIISHRLFCCTFTFMIPFTAPKSFFLGLFWMFPSLFQFILCVTWQQRVLWALVCSALCHVCYYFLHLPKYLSRASPRWIHSLSVAAAWNYPIFFGGEAVPSLSRSSPALRLWSTWDLCSWVLTVLVDIACVLAGWRYQSKFML